MKNTQFKHKNLPQKQQTQTNQTLDSIAKACFSEELVKDLFGGKMTHLSFDCPENLRIAFKSECKRQGLSVCHLLRNFMTSFIIASRLKACFPNTMDVPFVNIEQLVTPVFVKGRVRRFREVGHVESDKVENGRFYCALRDEHVLGDALPVVDCHGCPNSSCRKYVFQILDEGF